MPNYTPDQTTARLAGAALALASVLAIAGFTALGSVFAYPQILHESTSDILALFREQQTAVMSWFGVLIVGAALMAPAGLWIGRLVGGSLGRGIAAAGVAPRHRPGRRPSALADPRARPSARTRSTPADASPPSSGSNFWHTVLGTVIGETVGYTLTALSRCSSSSAASLPASPLARAAGLRCRGPHRHRRSGPPRPGRQPHQLRRVHPLVRLAARRRRGVGPIPRAQPGPRRGLMRPLGATTHIQEFAAVRGVSRGHRLPAGRRPERSRGHPESGALAGFGRRGDGRGVPVGRRAPPPAAVDHDREGEQDQGGHDLPAAGHDDHRAGRVDRGVDQPGGQRASTGIDEQRADQVALERRRDETAPPR